MVQIIAESSESRVIGLFALREANILTGDISSTKRKVPLSKKHAKTRSEDKNLLRVVLNLHAKLSHPRYRDMLKTIRILVHMQK